MATSGPTAAARADQGRLSEALTEAVPAKHLDRNLLIGTWNIRAFGDLTEKWQAGAEDSPKRDLHALLMITEILHRFDVIAVQEVKGNIKALRTLMHWLGPSWGLILTDVTRGDPGNDERLAFLFDLRRVKPSGLACELVVPEDQDVPQRALEEQFARTPYAVSFISGGQTFILVTLHVIFGDKPQDRLGELKGIADWLADWAKDTADYNQNLIALGDFNIDREGDPNYEAFASRGLEPAPKLKGLPRTIFDKPEKSSFYDQIAWFAEGDKERLTLEHSGRAGNFDFREVVYQGLEGQDLSWRISDHLPLWAEFLIPEALGQVETNA